MAVTRALVVRAGAVAILMAQEVMMMLEVLMLRVMTKPSTKTLKAKLPKARLTRPRGRARSSETPR